MTVVDERVRRCAAPTPGRCRRWPEWAGLAAGVWSFAYGALGLFWALGGAGFPFGLGDPDAESTLFPAAAPRAGGATIAALGLAGAGLALALSRRWGGAAPRAELPAGPAGHGAAGPQHSGGGRSRGTLRGVLMAAAWGLAVALLVAVPDYRVLVAVGYAPVFLLGAPFGWPPVSFAEALPWPVLNQVVCMTGGALWAGAALAYQRRTADLRGSRGGRGWTAPAAAARWGRWAVAAAMAVPLLYATTRYAWLLGIGLGMDPELLREGQEGGYWLAGAALATFAVVGAILTLGLAQRWGEVFPRWIPVLAGRRVPPALAVVPASVVAVCVTAAGKTFVRLAGTSDMAAGAGLGGYLMVLFPLWGVALGAATLAYHLRRRPDPGDHSKK